MNNEEKFRILIVDDEKSNLDVLNHILKPQYDVFVAKSGHKALKMAMEIKPDLILLDIIMPDMSGFDVLVELKGNDITHEIPVIFITGLTSTEDEERGFFLGAVDYIIKPFHNTIVKARVGNHLQIVKQIRTIEHLCMIDVLTNIPNRRSFDQQLKTEWRRAAREKMPISILMLDLDKFKDYNDTYGHPQGDILLQTVVTVFKKNLKRSTDFAARWGGEEFVILLPNTSLNGALVVAEQIRLDVERLVIPTVDGINTKTTVSIGVSTEIPSLDSVVFDFISKVDKALYAAKNSGRNRVCSL